MDSISFRYKVAEAVHRAVCRFTSGDGVGQCQLYAVAGSGLLTRLTKRLFMPQSGVLQVLAEEPDGWLAADPREWGSPEVALSVGEFHCWIADVTGREPGIGPAKTLIDLASRHYPSLGDHCLGERLTWNRPAPPTFVWIDDGHLPDWLRLIPEPGLTHEIIRRYVERLDFFGPLIRDAIGTYDSLVQQSVNRDRTKERRKARRAERKRKKKCRTRR